jgi:hypothetical protein
MVGPSVGDQHPPQDNGNNAVLPTYGFIESKASYGEPHEEHLVGYGQGNPDSDPGFTALSSLIVNAYLCDEFGAQIYSSYYKHLLLLAAIMYVDDTDLIHWARKPSCTPEKTRYHRTDCHIRLGGPRDCYRSSNKTREMQRLLLSVLV